MRTQAKFEITGYVGEIQANGKVTHLKVAAHYRRKDGDSWTDDTYWNRVAVFSDERRQYIADNIKVGDLVEAEGRMRDTSYERGGKTIYATDRIVYQFRKLEAEQADEAA
mgnify:FL=1